MDDLLSKRDRLQASVDQDLDARRHGRGEAEIIRGSHPVDHDAGLVAARHSPDDRAIVGDHRLACEVALSRPVVEPAVDAAQLASRNETLQRLVDGRATTEISEITGCPYLCRRCVDAGNEPRPEVCGWLIKHVRNMMQISVDGKIVRPNYATFFGHSFPEKSSFKAMRISKHIYK
ncbi:hypothetical protein J2R73_011368 [Bradyrhizobium japonicum]|nr:hypothetical protein [Bradyrhizobium japonicum]MCP1866287.1 hypothetical protein [Bradyrhizobium japonicum]MCP1955109.1 hypothetical protein [Bradyrhizobium japonicum]MCW2319482.1 hypothetical protein [Bradyrhizobium japonicum]